METKFLEEVIKQQQKQVVLMAERMCVNATNIEHNWDSEFKPIVVDTAASRTLTPFLKDLKEPIPCSMDVKGLGKGKITHKGRVEWKVYDMEGQVVTIVDENAYCCEEIPYRLFCPHRLKEAQDKNNNDNAQLILLHQGYSLMWNKSKTTVAANLDPVTNLPTISSTANYEHFSTFATYFSSFPSMIDDDDASPTLETMKMLDTKNEGEAEQCDKASSVEKFFTKKKFLRSSNNRLAHQMRFHQTTRHC